MANDVGRAFRLLLRAERLRHSGPDMDQVIDDLERVVDSLGIPTEQMDPTGVRARPLSLAERCSYLPPEYWQQVKGFGAAEPTLRRLSASHEQYRRAGIAVIEWDDLEPVLRSWGWTSR